MIERRDPAHERDAERLVLGAFGVTALSGASLLVVYVAAGPIELQGVLLAVCLGALGAGMVVWASRLMATPVHVEERHPLGSGPAGAAALSDVLEEEAGFSRRRLLVRMLFVALGGLGLALAVPVLSLGPAPGRSLFETSWRRGKRLVTPDGALLHIADVPMDGVATVFPEGATTAADSQAILIHVDPSLLRLPADHASWAPQGYVVYSKLCTHAGCPVGLYRTSDHRLICPCHQSTFDVLAGADPVFGPAARPLPQLQITIAADGTVVAEGDFPEPVGPSFWDRTSS